MEKMVLVNGEKEVVCDRCLMVVSREDAVEVDGDILCSNCVCTCYDCGEVLNKDNAVYCAEDGEWSCGHCADLVLVWCECCEEYALEENAHSVITSEYSRRAIWCSDCCERHAYECDDCGDYLAEDVGGATRNGVVCPNCISDRYYYCAECGNYVHCDEWDDEGDMCIKCADRGLIKKYHAYEHKEKKLTKTGECLPQWRGRWRGLGIELEVEHPDNSDWARDEELAHEIKGVYDNLVFERDGSIYKGFEIISQPHTKNAYNNTPWADILRTVKEAGYQSHNGGNCGLHVHLSREYFGSTRDKQERAVAKMIRFYDIFYNEMVKASRRETDSAERWAHPMYTDDKRDAVDLAKGKKYGERYQCVNINNEATVEIRIMRGTLKSSTFYACVDIVETIAKNSRVIKWADIEDASLWLRGISPATVEYLKSRNAFIEYLI